MSTLKSAQKVAILKRDSWQCAECEGFFPDPPDLVRSGLGTTGLWALIGNHLTIDHILPIAQGGTNAKENLQSMCYVCNNGKGDGLRPNNPPGQSQKYQKRQRRRAYLSAEKRAAYASAEVALPDPMS